MLDELNLPKEVLMGMAMIETRERLIDAASEKFDILDDYTPGLGERVKALVAETFQTGWEVAMDAESKLSRTNLDTYSTHYTSDEAESIM